MSEFHTTITVPLPDDIWAKAEAIVSLKATLTTLEATLPAAARVQYEISDAAPPKKDRKTRADAGKPRRTPREPSGPVGLVGSPAGGDVREAAE